MAEEARDGQLNGTVGDVADANDDELEVDDKPDSFHLLPFHFLPAVCHNGEFPGKQALVAVFELDSFEEARVGQLAEQLSLFVELHKVDRFRVVES